MTRGSADEHWIEVTLHETARDFLSAAYPDLCKLESAANTILPHALEALAHENAFPHKEFHVMSSKCPLHGSRRIGQASVSTGNFWLTCRTLRGDADPVLDIVLSCTKGPLGNCPIFLYSSSRNMDSPPFLGPRLWMIIKSLIKITSVTRIFSVFGPAPLVKIFSKQWSDVTGQRQHPRALYAAKLAHATRQTLADAAPLPPGDHIRQASLLDVETVGQLFKEFSDSSVYYPLSYGQSLQEAIQVISKQQAWVYETREGYIPTVVAVTRSSLDVATITKVYTAAAWRKRGYAERLVNKVARDLLYGGGGKQYVALFVGNNNPAASVYRRVGFVGLGRHDAPQGSGEWLEIGFQGTHKGHW